MGEAAAPATALPHAGRLLLWVLAAAGALGGLALLWPREHAAAPTADAPQTVRANTASVREATAPQVGVAVAPSPPSVVAPLVPSAQSSAPARPRPIPTSTTPAPARAGEVDQPTTTASARAPAFRLRPRSPVRLSVPATTDLPSPTALAAQNRPGLSDEIKLIARARRKLQDGDAEAALHHLALHAQSFEHGVLSEERRGLRVLALCTLGRSTEALAARDRFLKHAGSSLLAAQINARCAPPAPQRRGP